MLIQSALGASSWRIGQYPILVTSYLMFSCVSTLVDNRWWSLLTERKIHA